MRTTSFFLAALAGTGLLTAAGAQSVQTPQPTTTTTRADPDVPHAELAQDRGYDKPTARTAAVNAQEAPVTASLNGQAEAAATAQATGNADRQAQYEMDRRAYMDALIQHDHAVDRTDARYARQQRAYADAMSVWRVQVQECKKGHRAACDLPPPNVADYY